MSKPVLIDFFSCQGGAAEGYRRAGFRVIMSDIVIPKRMPPGDITFVQGNAVDPAFFWDLVTQYRPAVIAGSPPCQAHTDAQRIRGNEHPRLIAPFRDLCRAAAWRKGIQYVIENVEGARPELINPIMLCGTMFHSLHTRRHRLFESNVYIYQPPHGIDPPQVKMGRALKEGDWYHAVGNFSGVDYVKRDMGVPWMTRDGVRECIPPVYTEYIGQQLMKDLP